MLKLQLQPFWLEILPGQRTRFRPIDRDMMRIAREKGRPASGAELTEKNFNWQAFTLSVAEQGIMEWEGVGDAEGKPLSVTHETVQAYLAHWRVFDSVRDNYVMPAVAVDEEKNASAPSQNGTSGARTQAKATAATARKTARSAPTA